MTRPAVYALRMLVFLAAVGVIAGFLYPALVTAFSTNPLLNALIALVLLFGIGWNLHQVLRLTPEVRWAETFQQSRTRLAALPPPVLLAPMASMLSTRTGKGAPGQDRFTLSAPAMRSLLDSLASRLDESRELSRYMTGLLIFLGLLGTFWGLLLTVGAVAAVINGMSVGAGDVTVLFDQLKAGLARPLQGMGTAFSSSMFGLAGALVLGFLDLTAGQAQTRFFYELEEWLASLTRLSSGVLGGEGDASVPVYVQALLEQTAENMENLQRILVRGEEGRVASNHAIQVLGERIATLSDAMRSNQQVMLRIAEQQVGVGPALQRLGGDDGSRTHLRNIEQALARLASELEQGRTQTTSELRNDIRVLTRTLAGVGGEGMSLRRRGRGADALNPWPGYVDALSTLLMVIIFVLLVFVLGQAFLSVALTGKDRALDQVSRQLADLTNMLSLERSHSTDLQAAVAGLSRDLAAAAAARDQFATQAGNLQTRLSDAAAQQDALRAERDRLSTQAAGSAAQAQSAAARMAELQRRIADSAAQLGDARRQAADAKAELDQVVVADRATIEAKLADLAHLNEQVQGLAALRDTLRAQVEAASAQAEAEARGRAGDQAVGDAPRAQVALLNRQVGELRAQLAQVSAALDMAATAAREQDVVIANLGAKLNTALASKVEELQHYRSEFFGRLRDLLANRPGVQVVGDRFVFQSEVLFPPGSADMTAAGQDEIRTLASTLKGLAGEIPAGIPWIMRVDGHADRTPVGRGPFASNWELSSERAINVVKLLVGEGVPAGHLAATGFAEFQPLDGIDTPDAYARNRRIELRLTDR